MSGFIRRLVGTILCLVMTMPAMAESSGAVTLDIQRTKPTYIVWSTACSHDGAIIVTGLVRHRGPPGRNRIPGHVVATAEGRFANGTSRIDVPLVRLANPHKTAREARFWFTLPAGEGRESGVVRLRYVNAPMPGH